MSPTAARFAATRYGCRVTGIDLTADFVAAGRTLNGWTGLDGRVTLETGSALSLPYSDGAFDAAWMLHVGMNIADKTALAREAARVLRPGGTFGIYDIMRAGETEPEYPVPWATTVETSALEPPAEYRRVLELAGLSVADVDDRSDFARGFFERLQAASAGRRGPPPLGLHLVMGPTAAQKYGNMVAGVTAGHLKPVEIVARKPA